MFKRMKNAFRLFLDELSSDRNTAARRARDEWYDRPRNSDEKRLMALEPEAPPRLADAMETIRTELLCLRADNTVMANQLAGLRLKVSDMNSTIPRYSVGSDPRFDIVQERM